MSLEVLEINNLTYDEPESACVAEKTIRNAIFANPQTYEGLTGGEVIPILINSGAEHVDGSKSTLNIQLRVNCADVSATYFRFDLRDQSSINSGASVLNFISQVQLESKDGQLLFRENFVNIMQGIREFRLNQEAKNQLSMMGGYQATVNDFPSYPLNKFITFSIPLGLIAPFFNTASLIPSFLIAGSVLRLQMSIPTESVILYGSDNTSIIQKPVTLDIQSLSLFLQESKLYDGVESIMKNSVMKMNKGLSFPYYQNFNTVYTPTASSFQFDIQVACSKASYVVFKFVDIAVGGGLISPVGSKSIYTLNDDQNVDDPNGLGFDFRVRLGQMCLPLFPVQTATEAYKLVSDALNPISYSNCQDIDVLKDKNKLMSSCVPYNYYSYSQITPDYTTGLSKRGTMFGVSLERSSGVNLGGLSTNASKVITIEVNGLAAYYRCKLYASVQYLSVASVYENNVVVSK